MADLYLLQDGTHAAPGDCSKAEDGVLRHKNGLAVAMRADGTPETVADASVTNMNVAAASAGKEAAPNDAPAEVAPAAASEPAEPVDDEKKTPRTPARDVKAE